MDKMLRKVDIFVSSPGDVKEERQLVVQIAGELNSFQHIKNRFQLDAMVYEIETPGVVGDSPQRTVDRYMMKAEESDIFVCILWGRMGTPVVDPETGTEYLSGTYYEFVHAYESTQRCGKPILLLYRCMRPIDLSGDLEQALKVQRFFKDFEGADAKFKGLYKEYTTLEEFGQIFRRDLDKVLVQMQTPIEARSTTELNQKVLSKVQVQTYLSTIIEQYKVLPLRLSIPTGVNTLLVEEVAVAPQLTAPEPLPARLPPLKPVEQQAEAALTWDRLLEVSNHSVIVGEIGSGKTTLAQMVCQSLAHQYLETEDVPIPLYIPLLDLELFLQKNRETDSAGVAATLFHFMHSYFQSLGKDSFSTAFWQELLETHRVVLVLDGLDEVSVADLQLYIVDLINKLKSEYPGLQTMVTLRPEAYRADLFGGDYRLSRLLNQTKARQVELLDKLNRVFEGGQQNPALTNGKMEAFSQLLDTPALADRLDKPLFLTAAYLHYLVSDTALKRSDVLIQEKLIGLVLQEWDAAKFRRAGFRFGAIKAAQTPADAPDQNEMLTALGWHLYVQNKHEASIDVLVDWLIEQDASLNQRKAHQIIVAQLQQIADRSKLLAVTSQKVSFANEADRVYFAAHNFVTSPKSWDQLIPFLGQEAHHPLFFTLCDLLALQDIGTMNDFLSFVVKQSQQQPKQGEAEIIHLVLLCLLRVEFDLLPIKDPIISRTLALLDDKAQEVALKTRIKLGRALGFVGDPRVGSNMVLIPKGEFFMGYDMFPEDRPARRVMVDDFYIDKYPVTNAQYRAFIEDNGYGNSEYWTPEGWEWVQKTGRQHPKYWHDPNFNAPNYPVVGVSWYEAMAYAKWAGKRLPTEKEWEKAARGSERDPKTQRLVGPSWAWGNEFRSDFLNCAEGDEQVGGTTPIGIFPGGASPYGIYDICGTVSEWTLDWYQPYENSTHIDSHFGEVYKVRRGGGWSADQDFVRCTCRIGSTPTSDYAVIGFRCCASMRG